MTAVHIWTIGFTNKKAEYFFKKLDGAGVKRVIDVRLNNVSQLAGFTKKEDLRYFLSAIGNIDYIHLPELAPTKEMLEKYKKFKGQWHVYECEFLELMERRRIDKSLAKDLMNNGCLLCSEDKPHHCHRRLVGEFLRGKWPEVTVEHLI